MLRGLAIVALVVGCAPVRAEERPAAGGVLTKLCAQCHTGPKAQGDLDFIGDPKRLIASGLIVPGDASRSLVFRRIEAGEMPPEAVKRRPSPSEIDAIRAWIDGMSTAVAFRREADVARVLAADAASLAPDARANARWLTLVHLANAGVPDAQLERYRLALQIGLASLTWSPSPRPLLAVDAERTIFRIDLRELGWTAALWDTMRASYPYGIARGAGVPDAVRADWLVATATRAPLYHAILALPDTDAELARRLGVDLALDVSLRRVARAGFNNSGVSVNNRVIERHATRHGALWRSFDFRSSLDHENVFAHPLDFVASGGELIFHLPNGFQAYMIVDATGRRIDKAPTTIVSDPRRPDRAVETALSCIGCHAAGIIERADQIREASRALDDAARAHVVALYSRRDDLAALYAKDRARFAAALHRLGASPPADPADEPVTLLAARYETELDLRLAAAEVGLRPDELEARLPRSPSLRQTLGAFASGGTIKRDAWAALFPRVLGELAIGVAFTPRPGHDTAPRVFIDRAHRTWIPIAATFDQPGAVAACRRLGYELPRSAELLAAISDGLSAALALAHPLWTAGARLDAANQRFASTVDPFTGQTRVADAANAHAAICMQR